MKTIRIFMVAGEASGDALGAAVLKGLREEAADRGLALDIRGVGGPWMQAEGFESLFDMTDLSVMGLVEVLPSLPTLIRRIHQTAKAVATFEADILLTIDAPDFSFRVAKKVARLRPETRRVHLVAPSVWAWRPGRAKKVAKILDRLLVLLPFEPPYFEREGLATHFVGHPILDDPQGDGARFRQAHRIPADAPLLCVLPGSRKGEVNRLLPVFGDVVRRLAVARPDLHLAVPTVRGVAPIVRDAVADWPLPAAITEDRSEKADAFAASTAALAASGTVALELGLAEVPAVVAYKMSPITAAIGRRLARVRFANLVNILLDRGAVPELLQEHCTPDRLLEALTPLLSEGPEGEAQREAGRMARALLKADKPPGRAAAAVLLSDLTDSAGR